MREDCIDSNPTLQSYSSLLTATTFSRNLHKTVILSFVVLVDTILHYALTTRVLGIRTLQNTVYLFICDIV